MGMPGPAILVVEDDLSVQTTLCATLTLLGFTPHGAQSVHEALITLGRERIDAVTLDIRLNNPTHLQRSGLTLLQFLRGTPDYANVPVLIFTGTPLSDADEALARKHNADVFYKPQPYSVLVRHLSRLLDREPAA
jgi:DNA-binding response OmpR family regulator